MKRLSLTVCALAGSLSVAACGTTPGDDLAVCAEALLAAGSSDPAVLLRTAVATPACQRLASDVLQRLIGTTAAHQRSRGIRR